MQIAIEDAAAPRRAFLDFSFALKLVLAAALVTLADWLFFAQLLFLQAPGSILGLYALVLLAGLLLTIPSLRRSRSAWAAVTLASLFALAAADDPSLLALALFWGAAAMAVLLPRAAAFDDAWRWALRLLFHLAHTFFGPFLDLPGLRSARRRRGPVGVTRALPLLILPTIGSAIFLSLFAAANPLISDAFGQVDLAFLFGGLSATRIGFWIAMALPVWALLRPRLLRLPPPSGGAGALTLPGAGLGSVTLSLIAFNAIFALQNGLDLAFLWSGAPLPDGMTLAEYAHRGAYPLIATALLAGLFVVVTLRPGSPLAESPLIRRMVYLWIAQNVLLVASTVLRTLDYVDAYSLTRLRIAALIWMALVAVGLVLICWRIWKGRSAAWLIDANALAALLALAACSVVDLGAVAARWNVRHGAEAGGRGSLIDLCYLNQLGPSALLPLVELEGRPLAPPMHERVAWLRNLALDRLEQDQSDWHAWTFRNARRLSAAHAEMAAERLPRFHADRRLCDGTMPEALTAPPSR